MSVYFKMRYFYDGVTLEKILDDEPVGWDKVEILLRRDMNYFGVNYQYTDGDVTLQFDKLSGVEIIAKVLDKYGPDGEIYFETGELENNVYTSDYLGKLNLPLYKKAVQGKDVTITCPIELSDIHIQIKNRFDTKINLQDKKRLDGKSFYQGDFPFKKINLKSSSIDRQTKIVDPEITAPVSATFEYNTGTSNWLLFLTFRDEETTDEDILYFNGSSLSLTTYVAQDGYEIDPDLPFLSIEEDGTYKIDIGAKLYIDLNADAGVYQLKITAHIKINNGDSLKIIESHIYNSASTAVTDIEKDIDIYFSKDIDLNIGDKVYIYFTLFANGNSADSASLEITEKLRHCYISTTSVAQPSECEGLFLKDAIKRTLESITNNYQILKSDFLQRTGKNNYFLTTGYLLRNSYSVDSNKFPFNTSLSEIMKASRAMFTTGIGYEYGSSNQKYVAIEPVEYYYQDVEIIHLDSIYDYSDEPAKEFMYNEFEVGYNNYPDGKDAALDEYNTKLNFALPVTSVKNMFSQLSDFVASNYAIEETRRVQFFSSDVDNSRKATDFDENVFIISTNIEKTESEGTESFTTTNIRGSEDGGSLFNLRDTPKRIFYRWAKWLNGCLTKKAGTEIIKNTVSIKNGEATTTNTDDTDYAGTIKEKDDVAINFFDGRKKIFDPTWISFKARLSEDQVKLIRDAHTKLTHEKKNGYISFVDDKGETTGGWLYEMRYLKNKEVASFKLLKKDLSLSPSQGSCSDYADYTFAQFESAPVPSWIEDCTFENFN